MRFGLTGKTAVVTGGASGIGKAISESFVEQGAKVHMLEMDYDQAQELAAQLKQRGGQIEAHLCDVSDQSQAKEVIDRIIAQDCIDILVNNAGIAHVGDIENTSETELDRLYNVNIKGVYNCMYAIIPHMKERGGTIINMASVASHVGLNHRFAYSMSKGAVLAMTNSVAKDYLQDGIRCNSISPARVHTPFVDGFIAKNYPGQEKEMFEKLSKTQPIGRMANPEEVGYLAVYLCSDEASFITGTDFPIDGGFIKLNT